MGVYDGYYLYSDMDGTLLDDDKRVSEENRAAIRSFVEQGGRFVLLDELYLTPAARGRGWGRQALALARDWAIVEGASVMRLEVNHHNARAKALYLSEGYRDDERDILTLPLAATPKGLHR